MEQIMLPSQDLTNISYYESPTSSSSVVIHYANTLTNKNINRLELSDKNIALVLMKDRYRQIQFVDFSGW